MKTKLTIKEFRERLEDNTKIGMPELKMTFGIFSIFFQNSKYFYGKFDESTFRLAINYNFVTTFYILKGKYQNINNNLKLNYTVEPINKIGLIWIKFFPFIAIIGFNYFSYFILKNTPNEIFIISNLFIVFITFFSRWKLTREKKNLEQKFIEIFEIIA
ncbi:hypothetical protein [Flavobacterium aquiphilum]|uniref:hypothetical protein n=1 Tax=Flavobacterium aquiphilum TaxID=3003261 RepID=UPI0024802F6C|nr:hypothetical protein [Flavobacterium aquiphilum]